MYSDYFELSKDPFNLYADPRVFFASEVHSRAVSELTESLKNRSGLVLLLGELGTGKTTLCTYVKNRLSREYLLASQNNSLLSAELWLQEINTSFGFPSHSPSGNVMLELRENLNSCLFKGQKAVIFIDEGHLLPNELLDQILVLCNLEIENTPCINIVLSGLPELEERLEASRHKALKQRVKRKIVLSGLSYPDTLSYIEHRLVFAGSKRIEMFNPGAVRLIWKKSSGIPRLINHICAKALEKAELRRRSNINSFFVYNVLQDRNISDLFPAPHSRFKIALSAMGLIIFVLLWNFTSSNHERDPSALQKAGPNLAISTKEKAKSSSKSKDEKLVSVLESLRDEIAFWHSQHQQSQKSLRISQSQNKQQDINNLERKYKVEREYKTREKGNSDKPTSKGSSLPQKLGEDLQVQAIVWAQNPEARIVVINDRIFSQGEKIKNITIAEIREDNVKLEKLGVTFYKKIHKDDS